MNLMSESFMLRQLRSKTDRQLIKLIGNTLDRGLKAARHAGFIQAQHACKEAGQWLPLVYEFPHQDRRQVESKLAQLRLTIAEAAGSMCVRAAS